MTQKTCVFVIAYVFVNQIQSNLNLMFLICYLSRKSGPKTSNFNQLESHGFDCQVSHYVDDWCLFSVSPGTGDVKLSNVWCTGLEKSLLDCDSLGWGRVTSSNCLDHQNDVGVYCFQNGQQYKSLIFSTPHSLYILT